jgi:hypothetical protein
MTEQAQEPQKEYVLPENVLQATLNYLGSQPFAQVSQLVGAIQQNLRELKAETPAGEEEKGE